MLTANAGAGGFFDRAAAGAAKLDRRTIFDRRGTGRAGAPYRQQHDDVSVPEARLRLALQYLITTAIEAQPPGGGVLLALTESPAGTVLRMGGEGDRASDRRKYQRLERNELAQGATNQRDAQNITLNTASATTSATTLTLRRVKVAIASRVLEAAGASLVFGDGGGGDARFVLRIPRSKQNPDTNK